MPGIFYKIHDYLFLLPKSFSLVAACFTGERVVVVTHGGVIRAFHKRSAPTENLPGKIQNVSLNIFRLAGEEWMINTWGDTSHVSKTGYLETAFGGDKTSG